MWSCLPTIDIFKKTTLLYAPNSLGSYIVVESPAYARLTSIKLVLVKVGCLQKLSASVICQCQFIIFADILLFKAPHLVPCRHGRCQRGTAVVKATS